MLRHAFTYRLDGCFTGSVHEVVTEPLVENAILRALARGPLASAWHTLEDAADQVMQYGDDVSPEAFGQASKCSGTMSV